MNELTLPSLPFVLSPDGSKPCTFSLDEAGVLTVAAQPRTDLFTDPSGDGPHPEAGYLLGTPPAGDFTLSARITVPFAAMFDAGVLLVYASEERHAKICFEYSPQDRPTAVSVVTRGTSDDANAFTVDGDTLWLRIARVGRTWAFHTSTDGKRWDLLRYFSLGEPEEEYGAVRVGFLAQSPMGDGVEVRFAEIEYAEGAPEDLRDGS